MNLPPQINDLSVIEKEIFLYLNGWENINDLSTRNKFFGKHAYLLTEEKVAKFNGAHWLHYQMSYDIIDGEVACYSVTDAFDAQLNGNTKYKARVKQTQA